MRACMLARMLPAIPLVVAFFGATVAAQTTPPTVTFTTPAGIQRGTTTTVVVEGTDLLGASQIVFSEPGLTARILEISRVPEAMQALEPKVERSSRPYFEEPAKMQARVEITAESWMATGTHQFRIITPHGSSTPGRVIVSDYPEVQEIEPNDSVTAPQTVTLPMTANGVLPFPGEADHYRFEVQSGTQVVVLVNTTGSLLDPVVDVFDQKGTKIASNLDDRDRSSLGFTVPESGSYVARISDYQKNGTIRHFYRLTVGQFPFLKGRYPLGLRAGTTREFQVWGYNLGATKTARPEPFGIMDGKVIDVGGLAAKTEQGDTVNVLPLAIGRYDELEETGKNDSLGTAQPLQYPTTVNGRITLNADGKAVPDLYSFSARKGQKLILETAANRLGSPLDSVIEVLDDKGEVLPRVTARAVWKTRLTLRDRDSKSPGLRLHQPDSIDLHDYMVIGNELIRVVRLTNAPGADEDIIFDSFGGQRLAYEDTTPEAHALDDPIYKVELHPAGTEFPPNGMPVFRFNMRNDDGGPGYGKDSRVTFTAPADGMYYARVADVRNHGGEDFAYRFTIRDPNPDFVLSASPANPNIPRGSSVPVTLTAFRTEGFEGAIHVSFDGLPEGIEGTSSIISRGEDSTTLLLSHKSGADLPGDGWARYRIIGTAKMDTGELNRVANGGDYLKLISLMSPPDVKVTVNTPRVELSPGGETKITLSVERQNGFEGRVPFRVQNLPFGVRVGSVGLNGIMIPENDTELTFTLESRPWVKPTSVVIYPIAVVEALVPTEHAAAPIRLNVVNSERASK